MGLITNIISYKIGKRVGKRDVPEPVVVHDGRDPECLNYERFCKSYGSCGGQDCDYGDD